MSKKIISLFLLIVMVFGLTACGKSEDNGGSNSIASKELKASDLSIEDFKWETNSSKCNGYDCYVVSLTNNSKYDIIGVDFSYKVKDSVSESQLNVYDKFMKDHDGYIEEDDSPKDVTLGANKNVLVQKGEQISGLNLTVGFKNWFWYDYPTDEQFNLMEPKELQIGIVSGNKLYIAYYNFKGKSWKLDKKTVVVDEWTKNEIGKKLNKPNGQHFVVKTDDDEEFEIYSYGVTKDMYKEYVQNLKTSGFNEDDSYSSHFEGTNSDGYTVEVYHYENEKTLSISIEKE